MANIQQFILDVYLTDVAAVAAHYPDWFKYGAGVKNYLCVPDFPVDTKGTEFLTPGGYIPNGDFEQFRPVKSFDDDFFRDHVRESINHSWYEGNWTKHPWDEETVPAYTDFKDAGKYSWVKSPSFYGKPAQVGPLANVLAMYVSGHEPTKKYLNMALAKIKSLTGSAVPLAGLHSTLGRHAARAVRCAVLYEILEKNYQLLIENIAAGDLETFNKPEFPSGVQKGFGFHEAPRGVLSHWIVIDNGKIDNYQAVVPSTWNAGPRNQDDLPGPYEASLMGNPVADENKPLEVLRTVHSFDPCLACAIHLHNNVNQEIVRVNIMK